MGYGKIPVKRMGLLNSFGDKFGRKVFNPFEKQWAMRV